MNAATTYWARTWVRRTPSLVLLTLLVALGFGSAMAAAAGARRTASADERLLAISNPPSAFVFASGPAVLEEVFQRPDVEVATGVQGMGLAPASVPCTDAEESYFPIYAPVAGDSLQVPRPRLMQGRYVDPAATDEIMISEQHADRLGLGVGDHLELVPWTIDPDSGEPDGCGPDVVADLEVVGVLRELWELGAAGEATLAESYVSPAFAERHADLSTGPLFGYVGAMHLVAGTDPTGFVAALNADFEATAGPDGPGGGAIVMTNPSPLGPSLDAVSLGLWGLAGALALATVAMTATAVVRQTAGASEQLRVLGVLGVPRRGLALAAALPIGTFLLLGLLLAPVIAIAASPWQLIGLARRVEPDPGLAVDGRLLAAATAGVVLVLGSVVAVVSARAGARALRVQEDLGRSAVTAAGRLASAGVAPWASLGVGYALERPTGRRSTLPGRSAVMGVAAGTAGIVGVLAFGVGTGRANEDPRVYGWGDWDAEVSVNDDDEVADEVILPPLRAERDVIGISQVSIRFRLELDGREVPGLAIETIVGDSGPTVVEGRLPHGTREIALGKATAGRFDLEIGDDVEISGPVGDASVSVVGVVATPSQDGDSISAGWAIDRAALDAVGWGPGCNDDQECFSPTVVSFRPGADVDAILGRLEPQGLDVAVAEPSPEIILLDEVERVPSAAAAGVAVVALVGLLHAVTVTLSRRRHDLGIVRALGFDRRDTRGVVVTEGLTIGIVGSVIGACLGVVAGRRAWIAAAHMIGIGPRLPSVWGLAAEVVGAVVVMAVLISVWPARRAARLSAAVGLRSDQ